MTFLKLHLLHFVWSGSPRSNVKNGRGEKQVNFGAQTQPDGGAPNVPNIFFILFDDMG